MILLGMRVLAIADDTTGALEVGALLAASGLEAAVTLEPELDELRRYEALVVDAATRHLEARAACRRIKELAAEARRLGIAHIYLKTDSTLRGPIGAEFDALLEVWPERPLVWVPAYPALGRQVVEGRLLVDGQPLDQTAFARDPLEPARESSILRLLEGSCRARAVAVSYAGELEQRLSGDAARAVLVCDGTTEEDLAAMAEVVARSAGPPLAAGTGGFARYWIRQLPARRTEPPARPAACRWLVVNGSLHPRSREQIAACGLPCIRSGERFPGECAWAVLVPDERRLRRPAEAAAAMAAEARQVIEECGVDGLVVFGGDTLRAVLETLGASLIEPAAELLPGIPISRVPGAGLVLVSKAGGFGPPDVVARIRTQLES